MFITFEGIDFCGKSTQAELLKKYFKNNGQKVILIREPGGTIISEKVREILLDKNNSEMKIETEFLLFSSSRSQLVREIIIPALKENNVVISDRFHDSSTAYQGYGRGLDIDIINQINSFAISNLIPDITFFIDTPVEICLQRRAKKSKIELDRIELSSLSFYQKVRNGYLKIAKSDSRFRIVNGSLTIEEIHNIIIKEIIKKKDITYEK
jgi:dTMP kinase